MTTEEKELFDYLSQKAALMPEPIELRVTGGWVRDKLMNREYNDIDMAIVSESKTVTAEDFAKVIKGGKGKVGAKMDKLLLNGSLQMSVAMLGVSPKPNGKWHRIDLTAIVRTKDRDEQE